MKRSALTWIRSRLTKENYINRAQGASVGFPMIADPADAVALKRAEFSVKASARKTSPS